MSTSIWVRLGRSPRGRRLGLAGATLMVAAAVVVVVVALAGSGGRGPLTEAAATTTAGAATRPAVPVPPVSDSELAALPAADTFNTLAGAPTDPDPAADTDGTVAHNTQALPVFSTPGGHLLARLPILEVGSPTWVPVVEQQPGWVRVLLPTRPNGAAGWIDGSRVQLRHTPDEIRVHLGSTTLQLLRDGAIAGTWQVGIGTSGTPTPTGRTYLLASIHDTSQTFSPVILPLGFHSQVLDTFGTGPGTVALHTWPDEHVFGAPTSHGCIRVPDAALQALLIVPLGTLVVISAA